MATAASVAGNKPTFLEHLQELRRRLLYTVLALIAGGTAGYFGRVAIIAKLQEPINQPLYYSSPSGSFEFVMRVCLAVGVLAALPVFVYNLIRFIEPAFTTQRLSRRRILFVIASSVFLASVGIIFAYQIILPMSFKFFASFNVGPIKPLISTSDYFTFVLSCLVSFAAIFQLPLLILFVNSIRPFPPGKLRHYRRWVIIGSFALAIVLPFTYDPATQFIVAVPIILLFELSLFLVWLTNRRRPAA